MAHHWEGPSEQCPRCGDWTRDLDIHRMEYCVGKSPPPENRIAEFVRTYGYDVVMRWAAATEAKVKQEKKDRELLEYSQKQEELMRRIVDGNKAGEELKALQDEWARRIDGGGQTG